jgi:hypothetical protein
MRQRLIPFFAWALLGPGCGYTLGYRTPPGVKTVAVPIFANATFPLRREVEFELTSSFRQELQARTGLRIVDETGSPDLVVRGRIVEFREWVIAEGRLDVKTESSVVARVDLSIENYLDGTLRPAQVYDSEPFSIEAGESFAVGRARAIRKLAEKLVVALEDWQGEAPAGGPEVGGGGSQGGPLSGSSSEHRVDRAPGKVRIGGAFEGAGDPRESQVGESSPKH